MALSVYSQYLQLLAMANADKDMITLREIAAQALEHPALSQGQRAYIRGILLARTDG